MQSNENRYLSGARKILSECLSLEMGDDVIVFCDDTTIDVVNFITTAAKELGVECVVIYEPVTLQPTHNPSDNFPLLLKGLIDKTGAILTCLNDRADCLPFRKWIITKGLGGPRRIGHMPGASLETLSFADIDHSQLQTDCLRLAIALAKGNHITITTWDRTGNPYSLRAEIGRWERIPVASDGIIPIGAWGNVPGGETYIAPLARTAQGDAIINIALPGLPFWGKGGSEQLCVGELLLHFEDGDLVGFETASDAIRSVLEQEIFYAESHRDAHWRCLAEIGLGANRDIKKPTGTSSIDEKMYGTTHIAIGDNMSHGGENESLIHFDMVTLAQIEVDGKIIVSNGHICLDQNEWHEHLNYIEPIQDLPEILVRCSGNKFEIERQLLFRVLGTGAGRFLKIPVGDPETAAIAARVIKRLRFDSYISGTILGEQSEVPLESLSRILQLLIDYQLIEVQSKLTTPPII